MENIYELFQLSDSKPLVVQKRLVAESTEFSGEVLVRLNYDIDAGVMYPTFYFDSKCCANFDFIMIGMLRDFATTLAPQGVTDVRLPKDMSNGFKLAMSNGSPFAAMGLWNDGSSLDQLDITGFPFSGRMFLYCEEEVVLSDSVREFCKMNGITPVVRGPRYSQHIGRSMKPKAFVSHDSRDKEEVARPIAEGLFKLGCRVWYDEFNLTVGDSLRDCIERGLKESEYCILVLTPNFLAKGGWPKREFDSAFTREIVEDRNVILPIWHGVTRDQVYDYSPILADRMGLPFNDTTIFKLRTKLMNDE